MAEGEVNTITLNTVILVLILIALIVLVIVLIVLAFQLGPLVTDIDLIADGVDRLTRILDRVDGTMVNIQESSDDGTGILALILQIIQFLGSDDESGGISLPTIPSLPTFPGMGGNILNFGSRRRNVSRNQSRKFKPSK